MRIFILLSSLVITSCSIQSTDVQVASADFNKAAVFDIDGTLTPNILSIYTARKDAARVVSLYADKGYKIIYLSARNRYFQFNIPSFLKQNEFPDGSIHVTQSASDRDDAAAFKRNTLRRYQQRGWELMAAYGDSTTDFEAYTAVGISRENIHAIKRVGEELCQPGLWNECLESWSEHVSLVSKLVEP